MQLSVGSAVAILTLLLSLDLSTAMNAAATPEHRFSSSLPRWDATDPVPAVPSRPFKPYAIRSRKKSGAGPTHAVRSHPEYEAMAGVLFRYAQADWGDLVAELVAALTGDAAHDEIAWVVVSGDSERRNAERDFARAGANLDQVRFVTMPTNSIWIRDYGPQFVWRDDTLTILDTVYFTSRGKDNFVPTRLADDDFLMPRRQNGMLVFGGDFFPGPNRTGFATSLVDVWNADYSSDHRSELYRDEQGIDTLHVFPRLPSSVDLTQHLDMWLHLVDEDTAVIAQFLPGSHPDAITVTDDAAEYMTQLGFEVFRVPALNGPNPDEANAHFTYANAYRVNDRIFIPGYGAGGSAHANRDAQALVVWQQAAPNAEIVQIDAWEIVGHAGSVACIVMPVPGRVEPDPTTVLIAPDGGEWLLPGETREIRWGATDDEQVVSIDLLLSVDNGVTFGDSIALNESPDGRYTWIVPQVETTTARVKVVAHDNEGRTGETTSALPFRIVPATQHVYDFSNGQGSDNRAWGSEVTSWNSVGGMNRPYGVDFDLLSLDALGYAKLAASDATGNSSDGNRYRTTVPPSGYKSAHVFQFTLNETVEQIRNIELRWEGFGDSNVQIELYVWDHIAEDWCDGRGGCGENRFVANYGGGRDENLVGQIVESFSRFIGDDGQIDLLVFSERSTHRTFHDYVSVTVLSIGDADLDGVYDDADCAPGDAATWHIPSEAGPLTLSDTNASTHLQWAAPQSIGGTTLTYDTIRSTSAQEFSLGHAICVEAGGSDTTSTDPTVPEAGAVMFYLVSATNACGAGAPGQSTSGMPRLVRDCS